MPSASEGAHFIVSSSTDLQRLLSAEGIDHTFLVQSAPTHSSASPQPLDIGPGQLAAAGDSSSIKQQQQQQQQRNTGLHNLKAAFKEACMLRAYQGHAKKSAHSSQASGKLSLVTFGAQRGPPCSPADASPLASAMLGMHRTFFMEERAAFGPAIDIWPSSHLPTQKVKQACVSQHKTMTPVTLH